ncbi:MAG TPA: sigma-70 family RNA polymerase sigma factor [Balneolales bacterium]|nr:sigma-70 family RNA polymerase sigma factor [Balneolales bacterium]
MLNWFKKKTQSYSPGRYSDAEWVMLLRRPPDEEALAVLREILRRGLMSALSSRIKRDREQVVEDFTQDALLKILDKIETYRGEARFTTWAMKIAVYEALSELRRKHWQDVSFDDLKDEDGSYPALEIFPNNDMSPDQEAEIHMVTQELQHVINESLTDKQRMAITSVMLKGLPIDQVAELMETNRNNMYKLIHDARIKIKSEFEKKGISLEDFLDEV